LTSLLGISNGNVILGRSTSTESGFTFIYTNNVFKPIVDSKAGGGVFANGIAANGLITGDAYLQPTIGSWNGFLASVNSFCSLACVFRSAGCSMGLSPQGSLLSQRAFCLRFLNLRQIVISLIATT
jgi:hypothetical protein